MTEDCPFDVEPGQEWPGGSPFVDVLHRLGFTPEHIQELEAFWWFMGPQAMTPDDVASAIMVALPPEDEMRRVKRMSFLAMNIADKPYRVEFGGRRGR